MSALSDCVGLQRYAGASPLGAGFREGETAYLAYEDWYLRKFRHWRGRSGRSYAFSVYAALDCPAYENAVLIVADGGGGPILACVDLGAAPEARLIALRRQFRERFGQLEFQIHVLAEGPGERRALIDDLS